MATPLSWESLKIHGSFQKFKYTNTSCNLSEMPEKLGCLHFISLLAGVHTAPCKSFFSLGAYLPGRTEKAGLRRGTCSTEEKEKAWLKKRTFTIWTTEAMIFIKQYSYLEHKNPTVTVIFLLWNALKEETWRNMLGLYLSFYPLSPA